MLPSTTSAEMLGYFNQLTNAEQTTILQLLKNYLNKDENRLSLEEYTKELDRADAEIEDGDFVLHEDVVKYFSKK